jgi:hypothetical protein
MILANVRHQLTRRDAQLATRLIAAEDAAERERLEALLSDKGIDPILDDPRLMGALLDHPLGAVVSLPLFIYVTVRHALTRAGEEDRMIADYAASVMLHFGARGRAQRISDGDDQVYSTLVDLLEDVDDPDGRRSLLVRAHVGNYALWLAGLFPDHIEQRRWRRGGPDLSYYEEVGRRGFELAAGHRLAQSHGLDALYAAIGERFAILRLALNAISDRLLFPNVHTPERLMRQVNDEFRWRFAP